MDSLMAILIGVGVFLIMGLLVFVKEFFKFKTDGKVLVRCLKGMTKKRIIWLK